MVRARLCAWQFQRQPLMPSDHTGPMSQGFCLCLHALQATPDAWFTSQEAGSARPARHPERLSCHRSLRPEDFRLLPSMTWKAEPLS